MSADGSGNGGVGVTPAGAVEFFHLVGLLKNVKRTGWVNNGMALPESVADHMYRMGIMSFFLEGTGVDKNRCMMMAIVHDLAEALAGDITPHDNVSDADKHTLESNALEKMLSTLPQGEGSIAQLIRGLWLEYEGASTPEAKAVKDLDKFEMIIQADEYEKSQGKDLSDFFKSTAGRFTTPLVQGWDAELRKQREDRLRGDSS